MDLNRSTLLGRLTQDLELKQTPNGKEVLSTSMVTNEVFTDNTGVKKETADFHNLVLWGKLAVNMEKYARKGSRIYVEGKIKTRSWEVEDGTKRYRTEVLVSNFILLDTKASGNTPDASDYPEVEKANKSKKPRVSEEEISIEDIPF